jgi:hypothetical protein
MKGGTMRIVLVLLLLLLAPMPGAAADSLWSAIIVSPGRWGWTVIGGSAVVTLTETEISFVIQGTTNEYFEGRAFRGKLKKEGYQIKIYDVASVVPTLGTTIGRPYEGSMDYTYPQTMEGVVAKPDSQHIHLINEFRFIGLTKQLGEK